MLLLGRTAGWIGGKAEDAAIEDFTRRAQPTVAAIHEYTEKHGSPPATLDLVGEPPTPNVCVEGPYEYTVDGEDWKLKLPLYTTLSGGSYLHYRTDGRYRKRSIMVNGWAWYTWLE